MRKTYTKLNLFILLFCLFSTFSARATHIIGADIEWQSIGKDSFELIVHAYRDCNGIALSGTNLTYQSTDGTCVSGPVSTNPSLCCETDITPICISSSCDRCVSNSSCVFPYGIEEFTITAIVHLPTSCCKYLIAWQESERSCNITTGPGCANYYNEVYLNSCIKPHISSPYFSSPPITMFCTNECIVYNPGIEDNDKDSLGRADSLSYSFGSPMSDHNTYVSYSSPYSNDAPLLFAGTSKNQSFTEPKCYGFHLDSVTGDIKFKATKADVSVLVLLVDIYRKDASGREQNVGEIRRDIEIIALACPTDQSPIISDIKGFKPYSIKMCAGRQSCFKVSAYDPDSSDIVSVSWNDPGTMKGATFTVNSPVKNTDSAVFCWTPGNSDARTYPYNFVVTAKDNLCPLPGIASKSFNIYVSAAPPIADYSAIVGKCGSVNFQASADSSSPSHIASYLWLSENSPGYQSLYFSGKSKTYQFHSQGIYHYTLTITPPGNACTTVYNDSVIIPEIPAVTLPNDTAICTNTTLNIVADPSNYKNFYAITWNTGATGDSITQKFVKDTFVIAGIKDATGCTIYDSMKVNIHPLPRPNLGPDINLCGKQGVELSSHLKNLNLTHWARISGTDTTFNLSYNDSVFVFDSGTYIVKVLDSFECIGYDTVRVAFNAIPVSNFTYKNTCFGDSTSFSNSGNVNPYFYSWAFGDSTFSTLQAPKHYYKSSGSYKVILKVANASGCQKTDSSVLVIHPAPVAGFSYTNVCPGDSTPFTNNDSIATDSYSWAFGDGSFSSIQSPEHLFATTGTYITNLKVANPSGCSDSVSQKIILSSCVWPGDVNDDKIVDMNDLLAIGIAYGSTGHGRSSASISWVEQQCADWADSFSSGVNYKHADCNGDSFINYKDTLAISANYGKSHPKSTALNQGSPSDPAFTIKSLTDTIYAGDTLKASVVLGSKATPVQNLYGLLFSLSVDPGIFDIGNARLVINPSFLGTNNSDLMCMKINNPSTDLIDIGITRIDQKNVTGYGNMATLYLPVKSLLPQQNNKIAIGISGNYQISYPQKSIPLYFSSDSFSVKQDRTGFKSIASQLNALNIYPNPFQNSTTIQYSISQKTNVGISLYDLTGRQIALIKNETQDPGIYHTEINAEKYHLNPGVYFLKVMTEDGYINRQIVRF